MGQIYFGKRIAALRKGRGMTQDALAKKLGISNQAVSKWESDQCCPDIMQLPTLADIFEISLDALFGREQPQAPEDTVVLNDLPWEDNGDLHAVCYVGRRMVKYREIPSAGGRRVPEMFSCMGFDRMFPWPPESMTLEFTGSVGSIYSDFSVTCGDVTGNVYAGDSVTCANVGADAQAGSDLHCAGSIGGNASAGDDLSCAEIHGSVQSDGDVVCGPVQGDIRCDGDVKCTGNVSGSIDASGNATIGGRVGGNASAGGDLSVGGNVGGNAFAEGNILCTGITGCASAEGDIVIRKG